MSERIKWSLVGIPDHQGVIHVGGRIGAFMGPHAFRSLFARLKGRTPVQALGHDAGDVPGLSLDVAKNHRLAATHVAEAHGKTALSVVVGGSHDHGYSHLLGISEALRGKRIGCINIDAHLDVRKPAPKITSGSPFYLALESGVLTPENFVEFGIQSHCNDESLWAYVEGKHVRVVPFRELRGHRAVTSFRQELANLEAKCDAVVISLDLDAAAEAHAPGVSAPQAEGFSASEILEICEIAGKSTKTVSLGIFELNPEHDIGDRTARLAATAAYHFLAEAVKR